MALLKVKTEGGWVEGQPSANQINSLFKGIPYAAPPVGELRWKAPQPVIPWEGVRDCSKWPNICPQMRFPSEGGGIAGQEFYVIEPTMSEDCLYLNIWTPAKTGGEALPVAVYIHGGGMMTGFSYLNAYDGDGFAKRGIVLVTINYRLNVFGGFAHPELRTEDPNNSTGGYCIQDQLAALKWVKANIAAFGGDPDCVTIFGQSGGGFSVQSLIAFPASKGYFKRAIMQSGGGLTASFQFTTTTLEESYDYYSKFMDYLNVKTVAQARAVPTDVLLEKFLEYIKNYDREFGMRYAAPKVDGYMQTRERSEMFLAGDYPELDYMIGCTSQEMFIAEPNVPPAEKTKQYAKLSFPDAADEYLAVIKPEDREYTKRFFQNRDGEGMTAAALAWCELQNELGRKPSYMYYFTLVPPGAQTAHHSAEHHYVFQTLTRSKRPYTGKDYDLSNELSDRWANFIKTGDPNGQGLKEWKPYTKAAPEALIIDKECTMGCVPETEQVTFLKNYALKRI